MNKLYQMFNQLQLNYAPLKKSEYISVFDIYKLNGLYPVDKIDWDNLSFNQSPGAIQLLSANPDKINWDNLSFNTSPGAIELLHTNYHKINWNNLSQNSAFGAIELLKANTDKINWSYLSENQNAIDLLLNNHSKIDWRKLSLNRSSRVVDILREYPDKVDWISLSINSSPTAIKFLKENPDKISWYWLSHNITPMVNDFLKENPDKINWDVRRNIRVLPSSRFPYGSHINWDKLSNGVSSNSWKILASMPNIFTYNYDVLKQRMENTFGKELIINRFHPKNMNKWEGWGFKNTLLETY